MTGYIQRRQGKQEEALRSLQRAAELDPRNFFTLQQIALMYLTLRRYPEGIAVLDRALAIKPDDVETRATRALVMFGTQLLREVSDPAVITVFQLAIAEAVRAPEVARVLDANGVEASRAAREALTIPFRYLLFM